MHMTINYVYFTNFIFSDKLKLIPLIYLFFRFPENVTTLKKRNFRADTKNL